MDVINSRCLPVYQVFNGSIRNFCPVARQANLGLCRPTVEASRSHIIRHKHKASRTPLLESSSARRFLYLHDTKQTQEKDIHVLSGILNRDPSNLAPSELLLRPHGHGDRQH